jgi:hypothetical protein
MVLAAAAVCLMLIAGCGDDGGTGMDIDRPTVVQTFPEDNATAAWLIQKIFIWFSDEMDASTLGGITVGSVPVHSVPYDTLDNKAEVRLAAPLAGETVYQVTIPTSVKDVEGHGLAQAYTFSFTTGEASCLNASDEFEPNDIAPESASIEVPCSHPVLSSCGADARADYYDFTVEQSATVTFRLRRVDGGPAVRWAVSFQRHPYQLFSISDSLKSTEEITGSYSCEPDTYTLRVGKHDEDEETVFYSLELEASAQCADDSYEENDNAMEASIILPGFYEDLISCYHDYDFYGIELIAGQTVTMTVENVSGGEPDGYIYILDSGYRIKASDSGTHTPFVASYTAASSEVHWLKATWDNDRVEYTMDIQVE